MKDTDIKYGHPNYYAWAYAKGYGKVIFRTEGFVLFHWSQVKSGQKFIAVFPDGNWFRGVKK